MATDLNDLIEPLKRSLAVPGEFDTDFPNTGEDDLGGSLADAFAEAQLDGFFGTATLDYVNNSVDETLSAAAGALVVVYSSIRILTSKIRNIKTTTAYKAGTVSYEVQQSANVLTEQMREMAARKKQLIAQAEAQARSAGGTTVMLDAYLIRAAGYEYGGYFDLGDYGAFSGWELAGFGGY